MGKMGFVADGFQRAVSALKAKFRRQVKAESAARLDQATAEARLALELEMQREIERRVAEKAPPDALY